MNALMKENDEANSLIRYQSGLNCRWHHSVKIISFLDYQLGEEVEVQGSLLYVIKIETI